MTAAHDEPDAVYGLVAHSAELARRPQLGHLPHAARGQVRRRLGADRRRRRLHASTSSRRRATRSIASQLKDVAKAEALDAHTVRYHLHRHPDPRPAAGRWPGCRSSPRPTTPRASSIRPRSSRRSAPAPTGSATSSRARFVSYQRRDDYWAKDLPVNRGRFNFDEVRYEYYPRPHRRARWRCKAGEPSTCARSSPRATGSRATTSPAVKAGRLVKLTLPDESPSGAQGFFLNTRRPKLADVRVRKALDYAFDFEFTNKNIFYGLYHAHRELLRELRHEGRAASRAPAELALLEPFRAQLPPEVFERALQAAGVGRLGQGPQAAARGRTSC